MDRVVLFFEIGELLKVLGGDLVEAYPEMLLGRLEWRGLRWDKLLGKGVYVHDYSFLEAEVVLYEFNLARELSLKKFLVSFPLTQQLSKLIPLFLQFLVRSLIDIGGFLLWNLVLKWSNFSLQLLILFLEQANVIL